MNGVGGAGPSWSDPVVYPILEDMKPADGNGRSGHWEALLFDLDGTLADSIELILHCYRYTMRTHLGHEPDDALWLAGIGTPLAMQLRAFARSPDELVAMQETYRVFQRTVHDDMVRPYPGVCETVDDLARRGMRMGVVTSKHREMTLRTLRVCGLEQHFEVIITPEDVTNGKPDPEPVHVALERLAVRSRANVLFVGDAPFDVMAGRAAGVRTAGALWGPFGHDGLRAAAPDYLLHAVADLLSLEPDPSDD
jgi:pyrophosphatase PpaX